MEFAPSSTRGEPASCAPRRRQAVDQLLTRFAEGDATAFGPLYDSVIARVQAVVRAVLIDPTMAEEVAQDVMVTVWRTAGRFDPAYGSARSWIASIARRHAVDRVRSEQSARDRDRRYAERSHLRPYDAVAEAVEDRLERQQVLRAVAALTPVQREAVELAFYRGYSHREVAALLDTPLGTVKTRLRDALARLRGTLVSPG